MSESKEFKTLLNKYNTLLAKAQDLQEQLKTKNEQWAAMKTRYEVIEKNTRELCEMILAKDKSEMVLGKEYSWDQVKIEELLVKTKKAYHDYNNQRKEVMQKIFDVSEQRRDVIEGLEAQISRMMQNGAQNVTIEDVHKEIEKEKKEEEAKKNAPTEMKKAMSENKVQITVEDEDDFEDASIFQKVSEKNEKMKFAPKPGNKPKPKPTPKATEIWRDEDKHEAAKLGRRKETSPYMIDLKEWETKLDDNMWVIIKVMGETGKSQHLEIKNEALKVNPSLSNSTITNCLNSLRANSIITSEKISLPLSGQIIVSRLDTIGIRLFENRFNKKPKRSEYEEMISEHTTALHGYGIKAVAEKIIEMGMYESVEYRANRKNPVTLSNGVTYIPDIAAQDKNGVKTYFEYELGHHTQKDFNAKCSKMIQVTDILNFIVPNGKIMTSICDQIEKWIVNKGPDALKNITVRVISAAQIQDNLTDNLKWKMVYEPGKTGTNPTINY